MEVLVYPMVAWAGCMEGPKLVTRCCFLLLRYFGEPLLKAFLVMAIFTSGCSWIGYVPSCEEDPLRAVAWLEVACFGMTMFYF